MTAATVMHACGTASGGLRPDVMELSEFKKEKVIACASRKDKVPKESNSFYLVGRNFT